MFQEFGKTRVVAERGETGVVLIKSFVFVAELDGAVKPFERQVLFAELGVGFADPVSHIVVGFGERERVFA